MGELSVGVALDVGLDLLPVVTVVADFLAVRADRQESLQLLDPCQRLFELAYALGEGGLERQHAEADLHTGAKLLPLERLDDVVVGAGAQAGHDVLGPGLRGDEDEIRLGLAAQGADPRAELEAVHARHRPVEDRELRRILALEHLPRLLAARGRHDLVAPARQRRFVQASDDRLVVDDQHSHDVSSRSSRSFQVGSAKNAMTRSSSRSISATRSGLFSVWPSCAASSSASAAVCKRVAPRIAAEPFRLCATCSTCRTSDAVKAARIA